MRVVVVYGFLGSGKTTVINHLLKDVWQDQRVVVIENESGVESVDGDFLRDQKYDVVDMRSGCVCCSLRSKLSDVIEGVRRDVTPDIVVIEPSGIASLEDIISIPNMHIDTIVTLIDLTRFDLLMKLNGDFYIQQFRLSPIIVLTKSEQSSEHTLEEVEGLLEKRCSASEVVVGYDSISKERWEELMHEHCKRFRAFVFASGHKPLDIVNYTFELTAAISRGSLERVIAELTAKSVEPIRLKGVVEVDSQVVKVDYVGRSVEITPLSRADIGRGYLTMWWCGDDHSQIEITVREILNEYIYG